MALTPRSERMSTPTIPATTSAYVAPAKRRIEGRARTKTSAASNGMMSQGIRLTVRNAPR